MAFQPNSTFLWKTFILVIIFQFLKIFILVKTFFFFVVGFGCSLKNQKMAWDILLKANFFMKNNLHFPTREIIFPQTNCVCVRVVLVQKESDSCMAPLTASIPGKGVLKTLPHCCVKQCLIPSDTMVMKGIV